MSAKTMQTTTRARVAAAAAASVAAGAYYGRAKLLGWGATDEEIARALPGDELIGDANISSTRAITVPRSPDAVWPWIAQLGQGRSGFYSYDFLENLVGCDIHSADRVIPEWQQIEVGDEVHLAPKVALKVALVESGHALVLQGNVPLGSAPPYDSTWAFVLREAPGGTTRLLSRERYSYKRWWARLIVEPTEAISFVMCRKMLRGIRDRAEREVAASRAQLESALSKLPELQPVAVAIFGGVVDPAKLHFPLTRMAASDARDWDEIAAWANEVRGRFTNRVGAVS